MKHAHPKHYGPFTLIIKDPNTETDSDSLHSHYAEFCNYKQYPQFPSSHLESVSVLLSQSVNVNEYLHGKQFNLSYKNFLHGNIEMGVQLTSTRLWLCFRSCLTAWSPISPYLSCNFYADSFTNRLVFIWSFFKQILNGLTR